MSGGPSVVRTDHRGRWRACGTIGAGDVDAWFNGSVDDAAELLRVPPIDVVEAGPK